MYHSELLELAKGSVSNWDRRRPGTSIFLRLQSGIETTTISYHSLHYIRQILQQDTSTLTTTIVPMHSQVKAWPSSLGIFVTKQRCDPGKTPLTAGQFLTQ